MTIKRTTRAALAKQTVEILECGSYTSAEGRFVDLGEVLGECLDATRYFTPAELEQVRREVLAMPL